MLTPLFITVYEGFFFSSCYLSLMMLIIFLIFENHEYIFFQKSHKLEHWVKKIETNQLQKVKKIFYFKQYLAACGRCYKVTR